MKSIRTISFDENNKPVIKDIEFDDTTHPLKEFDTGKVMLSLIVNDQDGNEIECKCDIQNALIRFFGGNLMELQLMINLDADGEVSELPR